MKLKGGITATKISASNYLTRIRPTTICWTKIRRFFLVEVILKAG